MKDTINDSYWSLNKAKLILIFITINIHDQLTNNISDRTGKHIKAATFAILLDVEKYYIM